MLTNHDRRLSLVEPRSEPAAKSVKFGAHRETRWRRAMRVEWIGQTAASLFWIASVLSYGVSSAGDWLQICAASAWFVANIAALSTAEARVEDAR